MSTRLAILGAGRIGQVHSLAIMSNDSAQFASVFDPITQAAEAIAQRSGASVQSVDEIASDQSIDAVIICTPTDLHAEQIELFARADKAIFCEKPIDLDSERARACIKVVAENDAKLMVGFNRRFDPHFASARQQILDGTIGKPEMGVIISRDPAAPPAEYIKRSGGIFKDMMIHDFDMAAFLMGDAPTEVMARGSVLTDPAIEELGDFDSATAILTWDDGRQVTISNSRRASYGYDQRIEVHGSKGMVSAENQRPVSIETATADGYSRPPLHDFFMTRYVDAYANEISAFIDFLSGKDVDIPTGQDGLNALLIAEAALESAKAGKSVKIKN